MRRLLLLIYLTNVNSDHNIQTNRSDIIITYEGHVEAFHPETTTTTTNITTVKTTIQDTTTEAAKVEENTFEYPADEDAVIFIPHEKEVQRVEDEFYNAPMHIGDVLLNQKAVVDVMKATTEPPNKDILFITGKNAEKEDIQPRRQSDKHMDSRRSGSETESMKKKKKLDCSNLICHNNLKSICGGKKENRHWRYRLFLNECYFRKVNCNFQYEENRYREVPRARCDNVGIHLQSRPSSTLPSPVPSKLNLNLRRSSSSRRTLNLDMNGKFCSHPCPRFCLENYDPECAMSRSGVKRVFMNHCKLDYSSCYYGEVWQRRPLADCIGFKKADMRENRGFIGWMQRAGMVDKKGKLTL